MCVAFAIAFQGPLLTNFLRSVFILFLIVFFTLHNYFNFILFICFGVWPKSGRHVLLAQLVFPRALAVAAVGVEVAD